MRALLISKWTKVLVFLICLMPVASLVWRYFHHLLTANPIEFITHATGDWTLRFLAITLSITPLRKLLRLPDLIRFRRMLGLFAFFYACLHFTTYIWLDQFFDLHSIYKDVYKRPFITAGFTAFVLLIPLAATSTRWAIRKLGKRWLALHRLIYFSATAGIIHYIWLVKKDVRVPEIYAAILAALLFYRIIVWALARRSVATAQNLRPALERTSAIAD